MENNIRGHKFHYLSLILILILDFYLFIYFSFDRTAQIIIAILISFSYGIWGITHHYIERNLNWKIVVEYSLFSIISLMILLTLVVRE